MNDVNKDAILQEALALAENWQTHANRLLTSEDKKAQKKLARLLTHPTDKVLLTRMIDQSFRSSRNHRVADQITHLLKTYGIPRFFSIWEKLLANLFLQVGRHFPNITVPRMIDRIRQESRRTIIPGEREMLQAHLRQRFKEGVVMNINHLGEMVLGEEEAQRRLAQYVETLESPDIEYISVKISTIYSQIQPLAMEQTVNTLVERLVQLYRAASRNHFERPDGSHTPKFVNLDMEEYRDLTITQRAFMQALDLEEFRGHSAGIVLQAYLPDSHAIQKELTEWARRRVAEGGAPIKLRLVKGANMEMELVEASLNNWPLAPYDNKLDVDANYKIMVDYGMIPENIRAVHLGIASHNLFELAYAYKLAQAYGVTAHFSFEMLEGMADHVRRAIQETGGQVVLYAPVASRRDFINAIGYLIRRLDENTGEENFLRYSSRLRTTGREWTFLKDQFTASCHHRERMEQTPHRTQNRLTEVFPEKMGTYYEKEFNNEPDTDWSLKGNREWARQIRDRWKKGPGNVPLEIPLVIAGEEIFQGRRTGDCHDPSQHPEKVCVARYALGADEDVERAVAAAKADPDGWRSKSPDDRHQILSRVAMELRKARGDLIGAAAANTGKVFTEADPEVSEAVDFAEFYPYSVRAFEKLAGVTCHGKGVGVVVSPWNFPIAIPCGGIVASLAAGNTVIFKPSSDAVLVAWVLCQCFWNAGVSRNVLQFLPCSGSSIGSRLIGHPHVSYVILTGGTETGLRMLEKRPDLPLFAETGGKNATIVTAMSDRDQAVKHVLHSAFSNAGQKCSATSLLILEKEVYEDVEFRRQLVDASKSFKTGSAWNFENKMGPLVRPAAGDLKKALTELEPGESWALKPEPLEGNPHLWSPGIKWGVRPDSYTHRTEFFGPLLGVMRADNLDHAIQLTNQTGYGLTSGLESLDSREQEKWKAGVRAGNLYINRGTTGAIVLRQPFGGMGKSALGPGMKAGGPDYVSQFMDFEETDFPEGGAVLQDHGLLRLALEWRRKLLWGRLEAYREDLERTVRAVKSYLYRYETHFKEARDFFHLRGQDNLFRYLPVGWVVVRVHAEDSLFETLARIAAARITGCKVTVSLPPDLENRATQFLQGHHGRRVLGGAPLLTHSDQDLAAMLPQIHRIRYAAPERVPKAVYEAAAKTGFYIARTPVHMEGRIELLQYLQQQSICYNYHRYGNLGERAVL